MNTGSRSGLSRRTLLSAGTALPLAAILKRPAGAAEFDYKFATGQDPSHPVNKRAKEAIDRIREGTSGRVEIKLFPAAQLGSDPDLLSQVRSGSVEFFILASSVLATLVPVAGIANTGFAFNDYDVVWRAMDGELGRHVREQIAKTTIFAFDKAWDNGFRHVSSSTREVRAPEDLKGFKIRVPASPMLTSLFKALDASPTSISGPETYTALQTKVVDGQENPLPIISTMRFYEAQKSISMTSHVWDGFWVLGNKRAWSALPDDARTVVSREFDRAGLDQRKDVAGLSLSLRKDLEGKGIQFIDVDRELFRKALARTPFYKDWKSKFGDYAWGELEKVVGQLA